MIRIEKELRRNIISIIGSYSIRLIVWTVDWRKGEFGNKKKTVPIRGMAFSMTTIETANLLLCTIKVAWPGTGELGKKPKRFSLFLLNVRTISGGDIFSDPRLIFQIYSQNLYLPFSCKKEGIKKEILECFFSPVNLAQKDDTATEHIRVPEVKPLVNRS